MKGVLLNGIDLQSGVFRTVDTDAFAPPKKAQTVIELAREHGSVTVFERIKGKDISLAGTISAETSDELEEYIDQLNALLLKKNMDLVIDYRGGYRQWLVNCANIAIARKSTDVTRCGWSMQLSSDKPYGTDGSDSEVFLNETGRTTAFSASVLGAGNYLVYPTIEIVINSIDPDDSNVSITIGNPAEDRQLTITGVFEAGDIITIDTFNKQVYQNNELLAPSGQYPVWLPDSGSFEYSDTATTRDVDVSATFAKRWL